MIDYYQYANKSILIDIKTCNLTVSEVMTLCNDFCELGLNPYMDGDLYAIVTDKFPWEVDEILKNAEVIL